MWPEVLLFAQVCVFVLGFVSLFRADRLTGLFFAALFVYGIFAQAGYFFRPDLSREIKAYFGEEVGIVAARCVLLSLSGFALLARYAGVLGLRLFPFGVRVRRLPEARWRPWAFACLCGIVVFQACFLALHRQELSWLSAQELTDVADNPGMGVFIALHKLMVGWLVVLYVMLRGGRAEGSSRPLLVLSLGMLGVFVSVGVALGNRTDFVALFLGGVCYEAYRIRFTPGKILLWGLLLAFACFALSVLEHFRYEVPPEVPDPVAALIAKDYFAPAHMLFAAVALDFVKPMEVVVSNLSNMLIRVGHPYLQESITELFNPGVATRSAGYAFYVFAEGFVFMGEWGFIYNAVVLTCMLALWLHLSDTTDRNFSLVARAVMGCMLINLTRGQSAYFVKYLYMFCIPVVAAYLALIGGKLIFVARKHTATL